MTQVCQSSYRERAVHKRHPEQKQRRIRILSEANAASQFAAPPWKNLARRLVRRCGPELGQNRHVRKPPQESAGRGLHQLPNAPKCTRDWRCRRKRYLVHGTCCAKRRIRCGDSFSVWIALIVFSEQSDKVQLAPKYQAEWRSVERHLRRPMRFVEPACREMRRPLAPTLVIIRERHAVRAVSHP